MFVSFENIIGKLLIFQNQVDGTNFSAIFDQRLFEKEKQKKSHRGSFRKELDYQH